MKSLFIILAALAVAYSPWAMAGSPAGDNRADDQRQAIPSPGPVPEDPSGQWVGSTIVELDGSPLQRVALGDRTDRLYEGDAIRYRVHSGTNARPLLLIVKAGADERRFPLLQNHRPHSIRIAGPSAAGMEVFIENLYQMRDLRIDISVVRPRGEKPGEKPSNAVVRPPSSHPAPQRLARTTVWRLRLRSAPDLNAPIRMHLSKGATVEIIDENAGWYKVKPSAGSVGWISKQYALEMP